MSNKIRNIVVTIVFIAFMVFFVTTCAFKMINPTASSDAERRPLAQFPNKITWEDVVNKDPNVNTIKLFENASVDQFPFREFFRNIKANFQFKVLGLKENNGYAVEDGYIAKIEPEFINENIEYSISRLSFLYNRFIKGKTDNVYTAIIPDKNYFFAQDYNYPAPDYDKMELIMKDGLPDATYINLFNQLELTDYYKADTHWNQPNLRDVVSKLGDIMNFNDRISWNYTEKTLEGFKGVYHAQSALYPEPENLIYLTNKVIEDATVYDYETGKTYGIYNFDAFEGSDGYDFFLSGTRSYLRIDNPNAKTNKELVMFRDSFGASLAPLLVEGYKTIYLIDIRSLPLQTLMTIDFTDKDVLFIYSSLVLNQKAFK
jgi:hypothetical protein